MTGLESKGITLVNKINLYSIKIDSSEEVELCYVVRN